MLSGKSRIKESQRAIFHDWCVNIERMIILSLKCVLVWEHKPDVVFQLK